MFIFDEKQAEVARLIAELALECFELTGVLYETPKFKESAKPEVSVGESGEKTTLVVSDSHSLQKMYAVMHAPSLGD